MTAAVIVVEFVKEFTAWICVWLLFPCELTCPRKLMSVLDVFTEDMVDVAVAAPVPIVVVPLCRDFKTPVVNVKTVPLTTVAVDDVETLVAVTVVAFVRSTRGKKSAYVVPPMAVPPHTIIELLVFTLVIVAVFDAADAIEMEKGCAACARTPALNSTTQK